MHVRRIMQSRRKYGGRWLAPGKFRVSPGQYLAILAFGCIYKC